MKFHPLTSIKAYTLGFPASTTALIIQETCFQALTSPEITAALNMKDLVKMFKAHWARARQSNNNHRSIRFATIKVMDASEKDIFEFSRDIAVIQNSRESQTQKLPCGVGAPTRGGFTASEGFIAIMFFRLAGSAWQCPASIHTGFTDQGFPTSYLRLSPQIS